MTENPPDAPGTGPADEDGSTTAPHGDPLAEAVDAAAGGAVPDEAHPAEGIDGAVGGEGDGQLDELVAAHDRIAGLTGDLQRLQAEYVNYKRRVDRDREVNKQQATVTAASALLPVLDDIDRAREHGEVVGGFKAVAESLARVVGQLGLERFGEVGEEFDPTVHEAISQRVSDEVATTQVEHVAQAGYRAGDRVVRAAMVTVVSPG